MDKLCCQYKSTNEKHKYFNIKNHGRKKNLEQKFHNDRSKWRPIENDLYNLKNVDEFNGKKKKKERASAYFCMNKTSSTSS